MYVRMYKPTKISYYILIKTANQPRKRTHWVKYRTILPMGDIKPSSSMSDFDRGSSYFNSGFVNLISFFVSFMRSIVSYIIDVASLIMAWLVLIANDHVIFSITMISMLPFSDSFRFIRYSLSSIRTPLASLAAPFALLLQIVLHSLNE